MKRKTTPSPAPLPTTVQKRAPVPNTLSSALAGTTWKIVTSDEPGLAPGDQVTFNQGQILGPQGEIWGTQSSSTSTTIDGTASGRHFQITFSPGKLDCGIDPSSFFGGGIPIGSRGTSWTAEAGGAP